MKAAPARPSSVSQSAESNGLVPVEQQAEVQTAWAAVVEARRDAEAVKQQLTQARARAHPSQTAELASGPHQQWSPRDFWQAKASLPHLEQEFGLAQATLSEAEDEHRAAVARAKRVLEPQVRAAYAPVMTRAVEALTTTITPVLEEVRAAVGRAAELGVSAPSPVMVMEMAGQLARALEQWIAPPPPARMPPGMTLVRVTRAFRILPGTHDVRRDPRGQPQDIDQATGPGVLMLRDDVCAVVEQAARDLEVNGFAVRVAS